MRAWLVVVGLVISCSKSEPEPGTDPSPTMRQRLGAIAGKAVVASGGAVGKARSVGDDVVDQAKQVAVKAGDVTSEAFAAGKRLKGEIGADLALAKLNFDLAIDTTPESEADYAARIAGMKQLKVGAYAVGIEQHAAHPLGSIYKWQFRFTWRLARGVAIHLSVFTDEEIPQADLLMHLTSLMPLAERVLD